MEQLRIHLFGGFLLERDGVALPPIASRAGRSLLAYLVMNCNRPQHREVLAGKFWPELSDARARRRLSHTLWQIQDVVNTDSTAYLKVTTDTLAFDTDSPYWLDVEEFDRHFALSEGSLPEAGLASSYRSSVLRTCVDLYRGDFLAGYFDDWVVVEQDVYRQRYITALTRLIEATKSAGAYEEALAYARRLTHHDPMSEEAHREVMRLCFLLGRTGDAVEQFRRCRSVLEEEFGSKPSPATLELFTRIVRQRRAGIESQVGGRETTILRSRSEAPFVGREDERRLLVDAVERVLAGPGGVALIEGEPGVGKTRLARELADDARWRGFELSWGSCRPGARRPFAPLTEILVSLTPLRLEQLAEQVAPVWFNQTLRLVPELAHRVESLDSPATLRPSEEVTRTQEALVHTLGALGRIAPHLVVIDDVQWADRDSLAVLTQLAARLSASRILLLLIFRSEEARGEPEVWDVIRDLDRVSGLGRAVLSPLSVFELEEMVRRLLGVPRLQPSVASRLHRETGGNALFALETLLAMRDSGSFDAADPQSVLDSAPGPDLPVAPRVRKVIESRIALLGADVIRVYQLASVIGDPLRLGVLEASSDMPRSVLLDSVDELIHRGLLREEGDGEYRLAHDQIRQVAYEGIAGERREWLHRMVAENLVRLSPDDVEEIGHHYQRANAHDQAADYLLKAGLRAVELSAYATACDHLQSAHESARRAHWSKRDRYDLLGHLEDALGVLGRRSDQADVLNEMARLVEPDLEADLARRRSWLLAHEGELAEAENNAIRSVEAGRKHAAVPSTVAASLVALGTVQRWSGRPLEAVPNLEEAVRTAVDDDQQRAVALTELASTLVEVQKASEAMGYLDEALQIYEWTDDLRGQAEVGGILARAESQEGYPVAAGRRYEETIDLCRRIGYRHGEAINLTNLANLHQLGGAVADALQEYDQAASIFVDLRNDRGEAVVLVNSASARHNLIGDDERAFADASRAAELFTTMGDDSRVAQCQDILAGVTARRGDWDKAERLIEESLLMLEGTGNMSLEAQHLRSLAMLRIEHRDLASAVDALERAEQVAAHSGLGAFVAELVSLRSLLALRRGDVNEGLALIRSAVEELVPGVERAYLIHHRHAIAAEAAGETEEARRASLRAHEGLHQTLAGLSEEEREMALDNVPAHSEIVTMAAGYAPTIIDVDLPVADAPTGKPLSDEELRSVRWTVTHPEDELIDSPIERRRFRLKRLLSEAEELETAPTVESLAEALEVSASTVRRDLDALRAAGYEVETRGQTRRVS